MGDKHKQLSEADMQEFALQAELIAELDAGTIGCDDKEYRRNVLDWGCGRGRSVAKLIERGFNAVGVDADEVVLRNGFALLEGRGLDPSRILFSLADTADLPDDFFCFVFSEETLEHVFPLEQVAREMFRLTAPGGAGFHSFPGSKRLIEPHLEMPLVHWLPSDRLQRLGVFVCLLLGIGPKPEWPETEGKNLRERAEIMSEYLQKKTCYRDIRETLQILRAEGFECEMFSIDKTPWWSRFLPRKYRENGFPNGQMSLRLRRPV